jgi:hypothetical protein
MDNMNGKNAKSVRKLVRRNKMKIVNDFMKQAQGMGILYRLKLAWMIVRGK